VLQSRFTCLAKSQPAAKFRLGYVTATVWKNDDFFNTVLSKQATF
jgi:hypothetical protein